MCLSNVLYVIWRRKNLTTCFLTMYLQNYVYHPSSVFFINLVNCVLQACMATVQSTILTKMLYTSMVEWHSNSPSLMSPETLMCMIWRRNRPILYMSGAMNRYFLVYIILHSRFVSHCKKWNQYHNKLGFSMKYQSRIRGDTSWDK